MQTTPSNRQERNLVGIGAASGLVLTGAIGEMIFAPSWAYGFVAFVIAVVAAVVFVWTLRSGRTMRPGAPINTQLQQPPPAIVLRDHDGSL